MALFYASYGTIDAAVAETFKRLKKPLAAIANGYIADNRTVLLIQSPVPLKHPFEQYDPAKHKMPLPSNARQFEGIVIVSSAPEALGGVQQQKRSASRKKQDPSIRRLQQTALRTAVVDMMTWNFSKAA